MKGKEKNPSASGTERLEFKRAEQLWFSLQDDEEEVSLMLPQGGAAKLHMEEQSEVKTTQQQRPTLS